MFKRHFVCRLEADVEINRMILFPQGIDALELNLSGFLQITRFQSSDFARNFLFVNLRTESDA